MEEYKKCTYCGGILTQRVNHPFRAGFEICMKCARKLEIFQSDEGWEQVEEQKRKSDSINRSAM